MKKKLIVIFCIYFSIVVSSIYIFKFIKTKISVNLNEKKEDITNKKKRSNFIDNIEEGRMFLYNSNDKFKEKFAAINDGINDSKKKYNNNNNSNLSFAEKVRLSNFKNNIKAASNMETSTSSDGTIRTTSNALSITTSTYSGNKKHGKEITKNKKTGNITRIVNYSNGLPEGEFATLYNNLAIKQKGIFLNGKLHGEINSYYENGNIKKQSNYFNGVKNGAEKLYFPLGNIALALSYSRGIPEGEFIEYHNNSAIKRKGNFLNGKFHGEVNDYYENEGIKQRTNYSNGLKNGVEDKYSAQGILLKRSNFIDNKEQGEITINNPDGKLEKKYTAIEGIKNGLYFEYDKFGEKSLESTYSEGKKQGNEIFYKNGKILSETHYLNGKKDGKYVYYSEIQGSNTIKATGKYKDDKKEGKWFFYEYNYGAKKNILIKTIEYSNGLSHGKTEQFRDDETKQYASDYEQGEVKKMYIYDSKGKKISEQDYYNNTFHGEKKTFFPENGKLNSLVTYKYGDIQGEYVEYNKDGTIKTKGNYNRGLKVGKWLSFIYVNDKQLESFQHYNEKGEYEGLEVRYREIDYNPTKKESIYIIEKLNFKDGKLDGNYEAHYIDGSLYAKGQYENSKKNGLWQNRFFDLKLKKHIINEGVYNNDKKIGKWFDYDENKKLISGSGYEYFEDGRAKPIEPN